MARPRASYSAAFGGGVDSTFAQTAGLTLNDTSEISANNAHVGGGVDNFVFGPGATATVILNDASKIVGNQADTSLGGYGGGIFNGANSGGAATVDLNGVSEVTGNAVIGSGPGTGYGGGIANDPESPGSAATVSCNGGNIIRNSAFPGQGGGIYDYPSGVLVGCGLLNVVGNAPDDIFFG